MANNDPLVDGDQPPVAKSHPLRSLGIVLLIGLVLLISHAAVAVYVQNHPIPQLNYANISHRLVDNTYDVEAISPRSTCIRWSAVAEKMQPSVVAITQEDSSVQTESGFIIGDDLIVTNYRTIQEPEGKFIATFSDNRTRYAQVIGGDSLTDIAVLRVPTAPEAYPAALGTAQSLAVGAPVATIGNPYNYRFSLSTGVVSRVNRPYWAYVQDPTNTDEYRWSALPVIQTDTAINPGNRGGPLFNGKGEVVGMVMGLHSLDDTDVEPLGSSGLNFALPIDLVKKVADRIIAGQSLERPAGAAYDYDTINAEFEEDLREVDGKTLSGVRVTDVPEGGLAALAELAEGDVILSINEYDTPSTFALFAAISGFFDGDTGTIRYVHEGEVKEATVQFSKGT